MRVIIAGVPEEMRQGVRQTVLGTGVECDAEDCVTYAELPYRILHSRADLIVFWLGANPGLALPVLRHAAGQTRAPIVALGSTTNSQDIVQVMRNGASEYLQEDDLAEGLLATLKKMRQAGSPVVQWGQIIAVTGAKPGVGVTTIACNAAFALATAYPRRVVLAELGHQVPELALNLDVDPKFDLNDLALREGRLDTTLLRQLLVQHQAQLDLLVHRPTTLQASMLPAPVMRTVLVLLRTMFEHTVIDLGHLSNPASRAALTLAGKIVVVVSLDVPTLRMSRRLLLELDDANVPRSRVVVVANRYGQSNQYPWKQAQEALGQEINEWIPDDAALSNQALNLGQPLVTLARRASITRRFDLLATRLNGTKQKAVQSVAV
jgi:pilus assembly protein CpaE